ncbi:hypothetical protein [Arthrobacter sp. 260]|uniref:hypothetical protein n=1 Tax=Arthrobacter sp. 260 TaxID=2735314 RepID=UPI001492DE9E|nr:hypothetical protein [Arthrobacter sp. 260]NOJ59468.1 hypothetical protein [Arthrobacter sp. 260]
MPGQRGGEFRHECILGITINRVGVDPSGPINGALDWAAARASRMRRPLILVHTLDDYWVGPEYAYYDDLMHHAVICWRRPRTGYWNGSRR